MGASGSSIKLTFCNNEFQDIKTLISSYSTYCTTIRYIFCKHYKYLYTAQSYTIFLVLFKKLMYIQKYK